MSQDNTVLSQLLETLDDSQAIDIITLDVKKMTSITDYMVVASGRSSRHVRAIAEKAIETLKHSGIPPLSSAGVQDGDWALVDFGDCILHVMQPQTRAFYNLEELWQEMPG